MSKETMLADLVDFFKKNGIVTECSTYSATASAPYTRQAIKKVFGSYELMLEEVRAVPEPVKAVPKPAVAKKKTSE